ncbi:hypothetical protein ACFU6K_33920 [Kitasatospora sp. NPDC057512]|uniref:hypothetical protein n=1 Tax=Kitasatospora sp. NPDC057512 TaxID=3346154 RepID=UPI0036C6B877
MATPADLEELTALPETFHIPLLDLGYRPIWDYRRDQLGIQGSHAGALLVDGTWYCPNIPAPLITATADLLNKKIDRTTWRHRVDARPAYRLHPKAAPDQRGARRLLRPAAGTHPTAACPIKPRSLERSRTRRVRGHAAQSLLLAFQLAHANHRKLAAWLDTLQTATQPARRRPTNRYTPNKPGNWTPRRHSTEP